MAFPWAPEVINFFIAASPVQIVLVQKVLRRSRSNFAARFPSAREACRAERKTYHANIGKKRQDLSRSRVMDTKAIAQSYRKWRVARKGHTVLPRCELPK